MAFKVTGKVQRQKGNIFTDILKAARISSRLSFGRLKIQEKQSISCSSYSSWLAIALPVALAGFPPWKFLPISAFASVWVQREMLLQLTPDSSKFLNSKY